MTFASKTAERINSMTPMEILDFVENAIVEQGRASVYDCPNGKIECAYRGKDGAKCAMGVVLDDADYTPAFEGMLAWAVTDRLGIVDTRKRNLLSRLQSAHDNAFREVRDGYDVSFVDAFKSKVWHVRKWINNGTNPMDMRGYNEFN